MNFAFLFLRPRIMLWLWCHCTLSCSLSNKPDAQVVCLALIILATGIKELNWTTRQAAEGFPDQVVLPSQLYPKSSCQPAVTPSSDSCHTSSTKSDHKFPQCHSTPKSEDLLDGTPPTFCTAVRYPASIELLANTLFNSRQGTQTALPLTALRITCRVDQRQGDLWTRKIIRVWSSSRYSTWSIGALETTSNKNACSWLHGSSHILGVFHDSNTSPSVHTKHYKMREELGNANLRMTFWTVRTVLV